MEALASAEAKMNVLKKKMYEAALEFVSEFPDMAAVEQAHEDRHRLKLTLPDPKDAKLVFSFVHCYEEGGGDEFSGLEAREKKSCQEIFGEIRRILEEKEIKRKIYRRFSLLSTEDKKWCFEWFKYQKSGRKLMYIADRDPSELLEMSMEALENKQAFDEEMKAEEGKTKPNPVFRTHIDDGEREELAASGQLEMVEHQLLAVRTVGEEPFKIFIEADAKKFEEDNSDKQGEMKNLIDTEDFDDADADI